MKMDDVIGTTHVGQNAEIENRGLNALEMHPDINQPKRPLSNFVNLTINLSLPAVRLKLVNAIGN